MNRMFKGYLFTIGDDACHEGLRIPEIRRVFGDAAEYAEKLGGTMDGDTVTVCYDADWQNAPQGEYRIVIERTVQGLLGSAEISAQDEAGEEIFAVTAAWQEAATG